MISKIVLNMIDSYLLNYLFDFDLALLGLKDFFLDVVFLSVFLAPFPIDFAFFLIVVKVF